MAKQLVVGLCGLAGSGKSTAARILCHQHRFVRKPFAHCLKQMVAALGVPGDVLDGDREAKEQPRPELLGKTVRHALQTLGTEWGRQHMGEDFWVGLWSLGLQKMPRVVADDVRFPNEQIASQNAGGVLVRIDRPGAGSKVNAKHASENIGALSPDFVVVNDGTPEDLSRKLAEILTAVAVSSAA